MSFQGQAVMGIGLLGVQAHIHTLLLEMAQTQSVQLQRHQLQPLTTPHLTIA